MAVMSVKNEEKWRIKNVPTILRVNEGSEQSKR